MDRSEFGKSHVLKSVIGRQTVVSTPGSFQDKGFQLNTVCCNRLVTYTHKGQSLFVSDVVIWGFLPWIYMQQYEFLSINLLVFKIDYRHRIKLGLYLFAYSFCITFSISKPHNLIIITYAKYQYSTFTISKSRHTLKPAFRPLDFKHLFLVIGGRFTD